MASEVVHKSAFGALPPLDLILGGRCESKLFGMDG